mgnify:CR=1 FL=1
MTIVMSLENVTLEYPVDRRYRKEKVKPSGVQNISLEIQKGEVLGIIGHNGSGKSTLANVLSGRDGYEIEGSASYEGKDLLELPIEERAQKGIFLALNSANAIS